MAFYSNGTINPDDMIISVDIMDQVFQLGKLYDKDYNQHKQQYQQS